MFLAPTPLPAFLYFGAVGAAAGETDLVVRRAGEKPEHRRKAMAGGAIPD